MILLSRKNFLRTLAAGLLTGCTTSWFRKPAQADELDPFQVTGLKIGELTSHSVIIWTRLTENNLLPEDDARSGSVFKRILDKAGESRNVDTLAFRAPGALGKVRVILFLDKERTDVFYDSNWKDVEPLNDFTKKFEIESLKPHTKYFFQVWTKNKETPDSSLFGEFTTAPHYETPTDVVFSMSTCQSFARLKDYPKAKGLYRKLPEGFSIYKSLVSLNPSLFNNRTRPDFHLMAGDVVYYDRDYPYPKDQSVARHHWHRIYAMPLLKSFHSMVPTYWLKDDHDVSKNDAGPGKGLNDNFSFEDGVRVFNEQTPSSQKPYRTIKWGKDLELFLVDVREFRDLKNNTLWGQEQKNWLFDSLKRSNAKWKILVSPTPILGPDSGFRKRDNHANKKFKEEKLELLNFVSNQNESWKDGFFILVGDRHWRYHSVHYETRVNEFSGGATTSNHCIFPFLRPLDEFPGIETFHKMLYGDRDNPGGFMTVSVESSNNESLLRLCCHSESGQIVYQWGKRFSNHRYYDVTS